MSQSKSEKLTGGNLLELSKADLHVHTNYSFDATSTPLEMLEAAQASGLSVIAITDHETIEGAVEASRLAKKFKDLEVIVGEEINTGEGEVLGLWLTEEIAPGLGILESIEEIRRQGGMAIIPHPFFWLTLKQTITVRKLRQIAHTVDAIEVLNASPAGKYAKQKRLRVNKELFQLPEIGSSDAHHYRHIGTAYTLFPGRSAQDLRRAITSRHTKPAGGHIRRQDDLFLAKEFIKKQSKKTRAKLRGYLS